MCVCVCGGGGDMTIRRQNNSLTDRETTRRHFMRDSECAIKQIEIIRPQQKE